MDHAPLHLQSHHSTQGPLRGEPCSAPAQATEPTTEEALQPIATARLSVHTFRMRKEQPQQQRLERWNTSSAQAHVQHAGESNNMVRGMSQKGVGLKNKGVQQGILTTLFRDSTSSIKGLKWQRMVLKSSAVNLPATTSLFWQT